MNSQQIKQLETELWDSANTLRANSKLTAAEYKDPVLGLILLRYAQNRFEQATLDIQAAKPVGPRGPRPLTKDDYLSAGAMMLPEQAQYDTLANLPEADDIAQAVNNAMKAIEAEYPDLQGVLPKNYQEMDADLLRELIRVFNKDSVKTLTGDVFGRIYEFFLMKFSMDGAGAQEGGEFFTPPSLVQLIVNLIQPDHGVIHDPACGSGGMFVQTGHFLQQHNKAVNEAITCYGTELKSNNTRLAKMNLAIHGIEGKIIEDNSFYSDPHSLVGKCDFVMANPPFNVKKVDKNKDVVKKDPRLFTEGGIPKADNGNYLWIQYFYHYLNQQGRAGFVMASSATDAGNSEKAIRQQLIETGGVDCIVSVGNNFFYTRSLPCHVWFLDKGKSQVNKDKILMIDARNTYRVVTNTVNDFSPGQLQNFSAIMEAYRGDQTAITKAAEQHQQQTQALAKTLAKSANQLRERCQQLISDSPSTLDFSSVSAALASEITVPTALTLEQASSLQAQLSAPVEPLADAIKQLQAVFDENKQTLKQNGQKPNKAEKQKSDAESKQLKTLQAAISEYNQSQKEALANYKQQVTDWQTLQTNFPDGQYRDIEGHCKIVDRAEVAENDYSLTPGRYVGYTIQVDPDFDYESRLSEIGLALRTLDDEAKLLSANIEALAQ